MPQFLVEGYVSSTKVEAVEAAGRSREAAMALNREGTAVRHVGSIYLPDDETCFHLYEATSVAAVQLVALQASLGDVRIAEVVEL